MNEEGLVLNDLHAEVLARRSLIKTLYKEMQWLLDGEQEQACMLLEKTESKKFKLRGGVKLHLYVSEPPCGDSSMLELG